tara:strand:- start:186 stop:365 length:180 start_codon:yes stop_codon:yes gene_type:complete
MNNDTLNNNIDLTKKNKPICDIEVLKRRLYIEKKREKQKKQVIFATIVVSLGVASFFIS